MQFDHSDKLLTDAFAIIAKYDPALFARMSADDWRVSTDYGEAFPDAREGVLGMMDYFQAMSAFGATTQANKAADGTPEVWINADDTQRWASHNDVPSELFVADVLAHEYKHTHQTGPAGESAEIPAFRAGSAFAANLPAPYGRQIKRLSDQTLGAILGIGPEPDLSWQEDS